MLDKLQEIMKTFAKIRLMADQVKADHQELIAVLTRTMTTLKIAPLDEDLEPSVREWVDEVVEKSRVIFKREWVRAKWRVAARRLIRDMNGWIAATCRFKSLKDSAMSGRGQMAVDREVLTPA